MDIVLAITEAILIMCVFLWLFIGFIIGITNVDELKKYEDATSDVPMGDLENFERPELITKECYIFPTSLIVIYSVLGIVRLYNHLQR